MQFAKIDVKPRSNPPQPHINYQPVCKCCQTAEVGGYIGNGTVLVDICLKCYRRNRSGKDPARNPTFFNHGGRS